MRGRSSKQGSKGGIEMDQLDNKLKQEPHLSGAYIRSLVKQLTTSTKTTKDPMNPKQQVMNLDVQESQPPSPTPPPPPPPPQQHKKQVRRRLHTSRPYQERLLNMAEARREIVTALKFHRAAMKQANEQQQQQQPLEQQQPPLQQQSPLEQEGKSKSRRNPRTYASSNTSSNNFSYPSFAYPPPMNYPYSWPLPPPPVAPPLQLENLNFTLPNQTLGLNLNLQDFNNLANNPTIYSNSSPSSSSSTPILVPMEEMPNLTIPQANEEESGDLSFHYAMDDKEMAEIRSIGEQHQIEWNDTLNLVTSAWWFKFLKTMEIDTQEENHEDFGHFPFDEMMEFPSWLNANEGSLEQHLSDYYSDDIMQDPALPCMEIEEIEGMDGEWLS